MLNKVFPIALTLAVVIMAILTYFAYLQLQSVGFAPSVIAGNYLQFEGYYQQFLWLSSVILLLLANILLWKEKKSWALWATLGYFAFFVLINGWWLNGIFADYKRANFSPDGNLNTAGLFSAIICIAAAVAVFFDQFIVLRMRERMHPVNEPVSESFEALPEEIEPGDDSLDSEV